VAPILGGALGGIAYRVLLAEAEAAAAPAKRAAAA
jgi:hypothetical protein